MLQKIRCMDKTSHGQSVAMISFASGGVSMNVVEEEVVGPDDDEN